MFRRSFTDQLSRSITINFPPKRIISLVPSQTELLFDLGLDAEIIGVTKFCHHPSSKVRSKTQIGGTKTLNIELIRSLKPDLIIGNKEENDQSQIEILMAEFPVWMSDISELAGGLTMITDLGQIINRLAGAAQLVQQIEHQFNNFAKSRHPVTVAYLIWQKPYMLAGANTFINDMLQRCGCNNITVTDRYPEVDVEQLQHADVIMLSSEPFPFKQSHVDALTVLCPNSKVVLVDGEMFSWYGSRMLKAAVYFQEVINALNK